MSDNIIEIDTNSKRYHEAKKEFCEKHKDADGIVFREKDREPYAAVYYLKTGKVFQENEMRDFFKQIKKQTQ